ncbi:hypothetical protein JAAARDRAFT_182079 [Jaapia argillacea MUCL 33604]|uniref:Serine-threonine/tyrosine-protein kinase catalytic domain-containing protein n=1 Tax=Jaapia argillacea MUCL 33604 TaxID=933084 RepID=A0A067PL66_9AGAM|nr:hypothetical protein JAAARDRAFT_182079 [Jaapia argillacea MUCL 33604]
MPCICPPNSAPTESPIFQSLIQVVQNAINPADTRAIQALAQVNRDIIPHHTACSLLNSKINRQSLLSLARKLKLRDNNRDVIAAQQHADMIIAELVYFLSTARQMHPPLLSLAPSDAESLLDVMRSVLDTDIDPTGKTHAEKAKVHRLLVKISESTFQIPPSLYLQGVHVPHAAARIQIGCGGLGNVYQGTYNGSTVVVKHLRLTDEQGPTDIKRRFSREVALWAQLRHPHILPLLGIDKEIFAPDMAMVSRFLPNGNLTAYVKGAAQFHVNVNIGRLLYEVSDGVTFLHRSEIVHGDLRGENVLIDDNHSVRLIDFGVSVVADASTNTHTAASFGSVRWMAPELVVPKKFNIEKVRRTKASDVYSFGAICLEIYNKGEAPFPDVNHNLLFPMMWMQGGVRAQRPTSMPDRVWGLVEACLSEESNQRPPASYIMGVMGGV